MFDMPAEGAFFALDAAPESKSIAISRRGGFIEVLADQTKRETDAADIADLADMAKDRAAPARDKVLRKQIEDLVSMALLLPMLKQTRDDPFKSEMFHGGFGEQVFGAQMDMVMAERLGPRVAGPIVDATYRRLAGPESSGGLNQDG